MYIKNDYDFNKLREACWCCDSVFDRIEKENLEDAFMDILSECFLEQIPTLTEINDIIRFDEEWIYECLGIDADEE